MARRTADDKIALFAGSTMSSSPKSRILPLFSPVAALYLVADAASTVHGLDTGEWVVSALGVGLSATPLWLRLGDVKGARRTAWLGVLFGISLCAGLAPEAMSLLREITLACTLPVAGALLVDMALRVPDRLTSRGRGLLTLGALVVAGIGTAASLPPFEALGELVLAPSSMLYAPPLAAGIGAALALVIRLLRRRLGSPPEALAASAWAVMGLLPGTACAGAAIGLVASRTLSVESGWIGALASAAAICILFGHIASIDARRRPRAGRALRGYVAGALTTAVVGSAAAALARVLPSDPILWGVSIGALWVFGMGVWRAMQRVTHWLLAPFGGRLLDALEGSEEALLSATSLAEIAGSVLVAIRDASGDRDAKPVIYIADPDREVGLDAAGNARVRSATFPPSITERFDEGGTRVVVAQEIHAAVVRRPEVRALAELLEGHDAQCLVPLAVDGELVGGLIVAQGRRGSALSLEEIEGLRTLGERVGAQISLITARDRAQRKVGELAAERDRLEEQVEDTVEARDRLKADARELSQGRAASRRQIAPVAYSAAMRELEERIDDIGPMDVPVALIAEGGSPVDRVARRIHDRSARAEGPFVVADCARRGTDADAVVFGTEEEPGWLRLAEGGTLLLADIPALPMSTQKLLAEALAARQARPADIGGAYPIDLRVIATSRVPIEPLAEASSFDAELARWLTRAVVAVPPLRERREDLSSLVLLALDRACRVLGREPVGIEQGAMTLLEKHTWPGNLRELQHVIDRAVAKTEGDKVRRADMPALAGAEPVVIEDPLEGTYAQLEERILRRAMQRAGGNKSEAARLLGLKRTTFLDKLRRHGIGKSKKADDASLAS